ncbi:lipopolysaccharide biosynthesis protein [Massilia litorea]|uniref:Oligosaccharide flippase family protein n=1 Tax=Massilia litorea TaxID=2769491 RepID=A0A7L9UDG7_9BURK|nr:oligosaccharide flippase family protein [Massilia litorea]QOL52272.1 oligosaccharide flippase family protein [Massilia litorea]
MFIVNAIRVLVKGEFNRNVLTLMTGTGLAQLIPLGVTPILSRLYNPEQFGVFALFTATVSSLAAVVTGRYELAIMLPRKNADAINVAALSIAICFITSTILLIAAWTLNDRISTALGNSAICTWLYFVPLAVLLNGIYSNLNYWSNRNKLYRIMAHRRVLQSGGTSAVQIALGFLRTDAGGLVIGSIFGQALASAMMANIIFRHNRNIWRVIDKRKTLVLAKRYISCVKFLVPAHVLSALAVQLPAVFVTANFGLSAAGYYLFAERLVGMPVSLVSASIGDVFRQKMAESYTAGNHCRKNFVSTLWKLVAISTPPFSLCLFFSPLVFAHLFGERWRVAGEYAQLMCPMFYFRFISNPLSLVAIIAQKNRFEFLWQAGLLMCLLLVTAIHYFVDLDAKDFILGFVAVSAIFDLINLAASYMFACAGDLRLQKPQSS